MESCLSIDRVDGRSLVYLCRELMIVVWSIYGERLGHSLVYLWWELMVVAWSVSRADGCSLFYVES